MHYLSLVGCLRLPEFIIDYYCPLAVYHYPVGTAGSRSVVGCFGDYCLFVEGLVLPRIPLGNQRIGNSLGHCRHVIPTVAVGYYPLVYQITNGTIYIVGCVDSREYAVHYVTLQDERARLAVLSEYKLTRRVGLYEERIVQCAVLDIETRPYRLRIGVLERIVVGYTAAACQCVIIRQIARGESVVIESDSFL